MPKAKPPQNNFCMKCRPAIKRPQFGIRLLLLVVALLATCFAWRHAVDQKARAERDAVIENLKTQIAVQQWYQDRFAQWNVPNPFNAETAAASPEIQQRI